jgi:hypothetical protein
MGYRDTQAGFHGLQVCAKIAFLLFQGRFQNPLEYLLVTLFECLLDGFWPVNGRQAGMLVAPAR